jgi:hypothetical protein
VTAGAFGAHSDTAFNRWIGWATVAAVPLAALGVLLVVLDKLSKPDTVSEGRARDIEGQLAAVVLAQAQDTRSRLIGAGAPGDTAANVRFVKRAGRFREVGGAATGDLASILEYYLSLSPGRLVVLGGPGAGKTVLVTELLIRLLEARRHDQDQPVPVLISASAYDTTRTWGDWLSRHLAQRFGITHITAELLVRDRRILPVVDGIDEMDPEGERRGAQQLTTALNASMHGLERASVVITCRNGGYHALTQNLDRVTHIELIPLTGHEIAAFLEDQFYDVTERRRWDQVLELLHGYPDGILSAELATPWRLTLALTATRAGADPAALIPPAPYLAGPAAQRYTAEVDGLLLGGYVSVAVGMHHEAGRYRPEDVQCWLKILAYGLATQAGQGASVTDIALDRWWQAAAPVATERFYFAMGFVPTAAGFIGLVLAGNHTAGRFSYLLIIPALVVPYALRRFRPDHHQSALRRGATGLTQYRPFPRLTSDLHRATALLDNGWTARSTHMITRRGVRLRNWTPRAVRPRDAIRTNGAYGLVIMSAIALTVVIAVGLAYGLAAAVTFGIAGGIASGLIAAFPLGVGTWVNYHVAVAVVACRGQGPWRLGAFLDWACEAGLLRVSGLAYQFRHQQLQDWLTAGYATQISPDLPRPF